jgi:hypothetical protein
MTFPLVLGSGRRLFNDGILPATMRPVDLTVTDLGIVIGTYELAGPVRHGQMLTGWMAVSGRHVWAGHNRGDDGNAHGEPLTDPARLIAPLTALAVTAGLLHQWRRNALLSIAGETTVNVILANTLFAL